METPIYVLVPSFNQDFWLRAILIIVVMFVFANALIYVSLRDVKYIPNYKMLLDMVFDNCETSVRDLTKFINVVVENNQNTPGSGSKIDTSENGDKQGFETMMPPNTMLQNMYAAFSRFMAKAYVSGNTIRTTQRYADFL